MRSLLFTVMILLAVIALPANAQNGTEIAPASDNTVDAQQDYTSTYGAAEDSLMQGLFDDNSEPDSSLKLSDDDISQDQPAGEVSDEKVISNLDALSSSPGSGSVVSSPSTGTEDIGIGSGNSEQASQKAQLNQTFSDMGQYSSEFPAEEKEYTSSAEQIFSPSNMMQVMESIKQSDVRLDGGKDTISGSRFLSGTNLSQDNTTVKDIFDTWRGGYRLESSMNIEDQARTLPTISGSGTSEEANENIRDQYYTYESSLKRLIKAPTSSNTQEQKVNDILSGILMRMNLLTINPETNDNPLINLGQGGVHVEVMEDNDNFGFDGSSEVSHAPAPKNYAVVVGINHCSDRRGDLHASVNDAQEMASLLGLYGYEVILLTDNTVDKPTKHNILDGALAEIRSKPNRGKVVVYFSGHGEMDGNGDFYLIPQIPKSADGDTSSYISKEELSQGIKDIKDLSLIVDACYSEELKDVIGDGQSLFASSKNDEPSNEDWIEPGSMFTYNLCEAIKERPKWGGDEIPFQECFSKAREETLKSSSKYRLSQTPISYAKKNGRLYCLN